jgi:hypothetical protein|tara:strand:- start:2306 stop:2848 length:543 start_codon:yes stop_codon:yes gene_type:complete
MNYINKIDLPVFSNLHNILLELENNKNLLWTEDQICINSPQGQTHNTSFGTGRLLKEYTYGDDINQNEVILSLKNGNWSLCEIFLNTEFENLFNAVKQKYKIGRLRLMKSQPGTCLTWHQDPVPRLHYPIKTQEGCIMVINNQVEHLQQDVWYKTDTTYSHTAVNASTDFRIHIVADIFP